MSKSTTSYLNDNKNLSRSRKSFVGVAATSIVAVFALLLGVLSMTSLTGVSSSQGQNAQADGFKFLCSNTSALGNGMEQSAWKSSIFGMPHESAPNRTWTLQEAFGSSMNFVNYDGEGAAEAEKIVFDVGTDRGKSVSGWSAALPKLEASRTVANCIGGGAVAGVASAILTVSNGVSRLASSMAVYAFDSGVICKDPNNPSLSCINLLKVIGGGAGEKGLITALTDSVYLPLLVIIVSITGLWVLWNGIVKRKYRESLFGALWVVMAAIIGFMLLLKPAMLVRAPMEASNGLIACVVGAFNGQNCFDSTPSSKLETTSDNICKSDASVGASDKASLVVNSLTCNIWKAFVLEPYASGNFGKSFDELDISKPLVKKAAAAAGVDPNVFCVNLYSPTSAKDMGARLNLPSGSHRVCNLAAYQMFLSTNASSGSAGSESETNRTGSTPDTRWYNLIVTVANDDGLWESWSPGANRNATIMGVSSIALFSTVLGSIVIIAISFFALMYYLTTVIMLAFAPIFLLLGVHPGKGKKMMIGWVETILSNFIKYLFSAIFLLVTIAFYAAVLGSGSNVGTTLIFVLILTGALLMYRNELMGMIGRVSMGGESLSNKMSQKMEGLGKKVGRVATATTGAAIGTTMAAGMPRSIKGIGETVKASAYGALDGGKREMKVGNGVVASAFRQGDRLAQDNKRDLAVTAKSSKVEAVDKQKELTVVESEIIEGKQALEHSEAKYSETAANLAQSNEDEQKIREIENKTLAPLSVENPEFAEMQGIINQLRALNLEIAVATATGDHVRLGELNARGRELQSRGRVLAAQTDKEEFANFRTSFEEKVSNQVAGTTLEDHFQARESDDYKNKLVAHGMAEAEYENAYNSYSKTIANHEKILGEFNRVSSDAKIQEDAYIALVPGQGLSTNKIKSLDKKGIAAANELDAKNQLPIMPEKVSHDVSIEKDRGLQQIIGDAQLMQEVSAGPSLPSIDGQGNFQSPISPIVEKNDAAEISSEPQRGAPEGPRPAVVDPSPMKAADFSNTDLNKLVTDFGGRLEEAEKSKLQSVLASPEAVSGNVDKESQALIQKLVNVQDAENRQLRMEDENLRAIKADQDRANQTPKRGLDDSAHAETVAPKAAQQPVNAPLTASQVAADVVPPVTPKGTAATTTAPAQAPVINVPPVDSAQFKAQKDNLEKEAENKYKEFEKARNELDAASDSRSEEKERAARKALDEKADSLAQTNNKLNEFRNAEREGNRNDNQQRRTEGNNAQQQKVESTTDSTPSQAVQQPVKEARQPIESASAQQPMQQPIQKDTSSPVAAKATQVQQPMTQQPANSPSAPVQQTVTTPTTVTSSPRQPVESAQAQPSQPSPRVEEPKPQRTPVQKETSQQVAPTPPAQAQAPQQPAPRVETPPVKQKVDSSPQVSDAAENMFQKREEEHLNKLREQNDAQNKIQQQAQANQRTVDEKAAVRSRENANAQQMKDREKFTDQENARNKQASADSQSQKSAKNVQKDEPKVQNNVAAPPVAPTVAAPKTDDKAAKVMEERVSHMESQLESMSDNDIKRIAKEFGNNMSDKDISRLGEAVANKGSKKLDDDTMKTIEGLISAKNHDARISAAEKKALDDRAKRFGKNKDEKDNSTAPRKTMSDFASAEDKRFDIINDGGLPSLGDMFIGDDE